LQQLFPRIIAAMGFPSIVNFVHFGLITILCGLTTPIKIWNHISKKIWFGLFILLVLIIVSALFNNGGHQCNFGFCPS